MLEIGLVVGTVEALRIEETAGTSNTEVNSTLSLNAALNDINDLPGTAGQFLSSTGVGTEWVDPPAGASLPAAIGSIFYGDGGGGASRSSLTFARTHRPCFWSVAWIFLMDAR